MGGGGFFVKLPVLLVKAIIVQEKPQKKYIINNLFAQRAKTQEQEESLHSGLYILV